MRVSVGTSGYAYQEWKGSFYPESLPSADMLRFYGERFRTVEINNTFYRMPTEKVLLKWAAQVPAGFTFVLKASQRITHQKRLRDVNEDLAYFLRTSNVLGDKRGPTLFQLPPNMSKDLARLVDFLRLVPDTWRVALEFRHPSWFADDVYDALGSRNAALCVADTDQAPTPMVATASWGYLRLRREAYAQADLAAWAERVGGQPWQEALVFFKHEEAGAGPRLAGQFAQLLATS